MDDDQIAGFMLKDWYVFDNFAPFQVEWRGRLYATTEHAYQAAHFLASNPEIAEKVSACRSPKEAQDLANANTKYDHPNWKEIKLGIMEEIVRCKVEQHLYIQDTLKKTGSMQIVETNENDEFWGWGKDHQGHNELGKIWMKLRKEILGL